MNDHEFMIKLIEFMIFKILLWIPPIKSYVFIELNNIFQYIWMSFELLLQFFYIRAFEQFDILYKLKKGSYVQCDLWWIFSIQNINKFRIFPKINWRIVLHKLSSKHLNKFKVRSLMNDHDEYASNYFSRSVRIRTTSKVYKLE